jgi:hypothetical protein
MFSNITQHEKNHFQPHQFQNLPLLGVGTRMSGPIIYKKISIFKTPKQGYFLWVKVNYKGF